MDEDQDRPLSTQAQQAMADAEAIVAAAANPNPACVPWCEGSHAPGEFADREGQLWCRRTFGEGPFGEWPTRGRPQRLWAVYVDGGWCVEDPNDYGSALEAIEPAMAFTPHMEEVPLHQVPAFAAAVAAAAAFLEQLVDGER